MVTKSKKNSLIKVTQLKSSIGCNSRQRSNLLGLGLKKIQCSRILNDTASIRGMIYEVRHLVCVETVK